MKRRQRRLERLNAVEREYRTGLLAIGYLKDGVRADPGALAEQGLRRKDAENFAGNLEPTYLIRLFAEFEAALRDVWANGYRRPSEPTTRVLIDSVGVRCGASGPDIGDAHAVREYRNAIVHEGDDGGEAVEFAKAKSDLGRFLARLPLDW